MIKVLSLVPYKFLPPDMGGQKGIAFFNRYLAKNISLKCISVENNEPNEAQGYQVTPLLKNSPLRYANPVYFFKIRKFISENQISCLIIEHPYYGWLGILLKWFAGVKLIVHSHNIEALRFKSMKKWWWGVMWNYERFVHKQADLNFFIHDDDRQYAIDNYKIQPDKCTTITYGFDWDAAPSETDHKSASAAVRKLHQLNNETRLLLFNGTLGYKPNLDALDIILQKINPLLQADDMLDYRIIICGSKLPESYNSLEAYRNQNIIYAGFVDDINMYFKGCDIFINPVIEGGGIKTKVVEALGNNLSVVSTASGAIGIPVGITGGKLKITADGDWDDFAAQIKSVSPDNQIPAAYFEHFFWGNIAKKASKALEDL